MILVVLLPAMLQELAPASIKLLIASFTLANCLSVSVLKSESIVPVSDTRDLRLGATRKSLVKGQVLRLPSFVHIW